MYIYIYFIYISFSPQRALQNRPFEFSRLFMSSVVKFNCIIGNWDSCCTCKHKITEIRSPINQ